MMRSAFEAVRTLRACPWEALVRGALSAGPRLQPVPEALDGLSDPFRLPPPPGAAACGAPGATWMPALGSVRWEEDPDVHADRDLLRRWSRGRLREALHAAWAARATGDPAHAAFAVARVRAFRRRCPVGAGCDHWRSGMEIGLRAVRLLHAAAHLRAAAAASEAPRAAWPSLEPLAIALAEHERELERRTDFRLHRTGNHYIVALAARLVLAARLPASPARVRRVHRDVRLLRREIARQMTPDGVHFESALGYHVLVVECLVHAGHAPGGEPLLDPAGPAPAIAAALATLLRPDGTLAPIGDSDDESFVPASVGPEPPARPPAAELLAAIVGAGAAPALRDAVLARSGLAVLAHAGPPALHATVAFAGPGRAGTGGHAHDDATSVDVWLDGPLVTDRGTGAYAADPTLRERLRSARSHAVLQVADREMNDAVAGSVFARRHRAHPFLVDARLDGESSEILVGHHGFVTPAPGVAVLRQIIRRGATLEIHDEITGSGAHDLVLRIPWAPGSEVAVAVAVSGGAPGEPRARVEVRRPGAAAARCTIAARAGTMGAPGAALPVTVQTTQAPHARLQGEVVSAPTTEARLRASLPAVVTHVLEPAG